MGAAGLSRYPLEIYRFHMKPICQLLWALFGLMLCVVLFLNDLVRSGTRTVERLCNLGLERVRRGVA